MSWSLVRVDDRLIHGQVVIAWGGRLEPRRIWVADDASASNAWERDLLASAAAGVDVRVVTVAEAAAHFAEESAAHGPAFLILRDLAAARALVAAGAAVHALQLGGLHYAPGKSKLNEYVYLDDRDRADARALLASGVVLEVQDVPASRAQRLTELDPTLAAPAAGAGTGAA
jgi:mannose/fructose/N-acetylgalactosamine-specific phosphotransferase system component IIB